MPLSKQLHVQFYKVHQGYFSFCIILIITLSLMHEGVLLYNGCWNVLITVTDSC